MKYKNHIIISFETEEQFSNFKNELDDGKGLLYIEKILCSPIATAQWEKDLSFDGKTGRYFCLSEKSLSEFFEKICTKYTGITVEWLQKNLNDDTDLVHGSGNNCGYTAVAVSDSDAFFEKAETFGPYDDGIFVLDGFDVVANMNDKTLLIEGVRKQLPANFSIPSKWTIAGHEYTLTEIGYGAFQDNNDIECITIPETVIEIGHAAFAHCPKLKEIHLPHSVRRFGEGVFYCQQPLTVHISKSYPHIDLLRDEYKDLQVTFVEEK